MANHKHQKTTLSNSISAMISSTKPEKGSSSTSTEPPTNQTPALPSNPTDSTSIDLSVYHNDEKVFDITHGAPNTLVHILNPGEDSACYELRAINDQAAEAGEFFLIRSGNDRITIRIPANDTIVTRTTPTGKGSLHQAILNTNLLPGPDSIFFSDAAGVSFFQEPVTINLGDTQLPDFGKDPLIIWGPNSHQKRLTIRSQRNRIFSSSSSDDLTLKNLVFQDTSSAVFLSRYQGRFNISNCEFIDCTIPLDLYTRTYSPIINQCLEAKTRRLNRFWAHSIKSLWSCCHRSKGGETQNWKSRNRIQAQKEIPGPP